MLVICFVFPVPWDSLHYIYLSSVFYFEGGERHKDSYEELN